MSSELTNTIITQIHQTIESVIKPTHTHGSTIYLFYYLLELVIAQIVHALHSHRSTGSSASDCPVTYRGGEDEATVYRAANSFGV